MKTNPQFDWRIAILISALAAALYKANDVYITHQFFGDSTNEAVVAFSYLIIGGWIGLICNFFFSQLIGKKLDPRFSGLYLIPWRTQIFSFLAGSIGAVTTFFMLWGSSLYDPSLVIPLASLSIVFLVLYDTLIKRLVRWNQVFWPMVLVIIGTLVLSTSGFKESWPEISLKALIILFVFKGLSDALGSIFSKEGVGLFENAQSVDAVNFSFWRFLWLVVVGTVLSLFGFLSMGKLNTFVELATHQFLPALPFILLTMFFVFFGNFYQTFAFTAKEGTVGKVALLLNIQLVLGIPITIIVSLINPTAFGQLSSDLWYWCFKIVGSLLIFWGVYLLTLKRETSSST